VAGHRLQAGKTNADNVVAPLLQQVAIP